MSAQRRQQFVIVPKSVLKTIIDRVDGTEAALCSAVTVAIRWLGNDFGRPEGPIQATIAQIGHRAGLKYSATHKAVGILEGIGVLGVERQRIPGTKANAPSAYTFPVIQPTPLPAIQRTLVADLIFES